MPRTLYTHVATPCLQLLLACTCLTLILPASHTAPAAHVRRPAGFLGGGRDEGEGEGGAEAEAERQLVREATAVVLQQHGGVLGALAAFATTHPQTWHILMVLAKVRGARGWGSGSCAIREQSRWACLSLSRCCTLVTVVMCWCPLSTRASETLPTDAFVELRSFLLVVTSANTLMLYDVISSGPLSACRTP